MPLNDNLARSVPQHQPQYGTGRKSDGNSHVRNAPSAQPSMSPTMIMIAMNRRHCTATGLLDGGLAVFASTRPRVSAASTNASRLRSRRRTQTPVGGNTGHTFPRNTTIMALRRFEYSDLR